MKPSSTAPNNPGMIDTDYSLKNSMAEPIDLPRKLSPTPEIMTLDSTSPVDKAQLVIPENIQEIVVIRDNADLILAATGNALQIINIIMKKWHQRLSLRRR